MIRKSDLEREELKTEEQAIDVNSCPLSVAEILQQRYEIDFAAEIDKTLREKQNAAFGELDMRYCGIQRIDQIRTESAYDQPINAWKVDIYVRAILSMRSPRRDYRGYIRGIATRPVVKYFRLRFYLNMAICEQSVRGPFVSELTDKQESAKRLSYDGCMKPDQYMLPVMYTCDYEKQAQRLLREYYPETFYGGDRINVNGAVLAKRMGLKIQRMHLGNEQNILGQLFFNHGIVRALYSDGRFRETPIQPGTIVINQDAGMSDIVLNTTIVHECLHMFLDRPFFLLQMMGDRRIRSYANRKDGHRYNTNSPIDWMELQTEKMTAYVLMEKSRVLSTIEDELQKQNGVRSPRNLRIIRDRLAERFRVSKAMAKYRMIELGYPEAEGIDSYVDGEWIPDYGMTPGTTWPEKQTYSISMKDAALLYQSSEKFADEVRSGKYIYTEGHFCYAHNKYVLQQSRRIRLTAYARAHIDECCMAFKVGGRYTNAEYVNGGAFRKTPVTDKYHAKYDLSAAPGTKEAEQEDLLFMQDVMRWHKLLHQLPKDMNDAMDIIMDEKGISQQELANRLGVERSMIHKIKTKTCSKGQLVGVCVALQLTYDVSMFLFSLQGFIIRDTEEDCLYSMFLQNAGALTVERCNEILMRDGRKPLFYKSVRYEQSCAG